MTYEISRRRALQLGLAASLRSAPVETTEIEDLTCA